MNTSHPDSRQYDDFDRAIDEKLRLLDQRQSEQDTDTRDSFEWSGSIEVRAKVLVSNQKGDRFFIAETEDGQRIYCEMDLPFPRMSHDSPVILYRRDNRWSLIPPEARANIGDIELSIGQKGWFLCDSIDYAHNIMHGRFTYYGKENNKCDHVAAWMPVDNLIIPVSLQDTTFIGLRCRTHIVQVEAHRSCVQVGQLRLVGLLASYHKALVNFYLPKNKKKNPDDIQESIQESGMSKMPFVACTEDDLSVLVYTLGRILENKTVLLSCSDPITRSDPTGGPVILVSLHGCEFGLYHHQLYWLENVPEEKIVVRNSLELHCGSLDRITWQLPMSHRTRDCNEARHVQNAFPLGSLILPERIEHIAFLPWGQVVHIKDVNLLENPLWVEATIPWQETSWGNRPWYSKNDEGTLTVIEFDQDYSIPILSRRTNLPDPWTKDQVGSIVRGATMLLQSPELIDRYAFFQGNKQKVFCLLSNDSPEFIVECLCEGAAYQLVSNMINLQMPIPVLIKQIIPERHHITGCLPSNWLNRYQSIAQDMVGQYVLGIVIHQSKNSYTIDLGEGIIGLAFRYNLSSNNLYIGNGQKIELIITKPNDDGIILLRLASVENSIEIGTIVQGVVTSVMDYGAFINVGDLSGLLHKSEIAWHRVDDARKVIQNGQELDLVVLGIDQDKHGIHFGRKQLIKDSWIDLAEHIPIGECVKGVVTSITNYGFFALIDGKVEGFVRKGDISWLKNNVDIKIPVNLGEEVELMILRVDKQKCRLQLSMKDCCENPWFYFANSHREEQRLTGTVNNFVDYGVFVTLEGEVDGLLHFTQLFPQLAQKEAMELAQNIFSKGDQIDVVINKIDVERQRVSLGYQELLRNSAHFNAVSLGIDTNNIYFELYPGFSGSVTRSSLADELYCDSKEINNLFMAGQPIGVSIEKVSVREGRIENIEFIITKATMNFAKIDLAVKLNEDYLRFLTDLYVGYPVGCIVHGKITNITIDGFSVTINEKIEGWVSIGHVSWKKREVNPQEVVSTGQTIELKVLGLIEGGRWLRLSLRDCQDNPWEAFAENHLVDQEVSGFISSISLSCIFVAFNEAVEGVLQLDRIFDGITGMKAVERFKQLHSIGDRIIVVIKQLNSDSRAISLDYQPVLRNRTYFKAVISSVDADNIHFELNPSLTGQVSLSSLKDEFDCDSATIQARFLVGIPIGVSVEQLAIENEKLKQIQFVVTKASMAALDCDIAIHLDSGIEKLLELCNRKETATPQTQKKSSDMSKDQMIQPSIKENTKVQSLPSLRTTGESSLVAENSQDSVLTEPVNAKLELAHSSKIHDELIIDNPTCCSDKDEHDGDAKQFLTRIAERLDLHEGIDHERHEEQLDLQQSAQQDGKFYKDAAKAREDSNALMSRSNLSEEIVEQQQGAHPFYARLTNEIVSNDNGLDINPRDRDDPISQTKPIDVPGHNNLEPVQTSNLDDFTLPETTNNMHFPLSDRTMDSEQQHVFDVFLCHNSRDKPAVRKVAQGLIESGIRPWLDETQLIPGDQWLTVLAQQIEQVPATAIFISSAGLGQWQQAEYQAFVQASVERRSRIIPVILPGDDGEPQMPTFLKVYQRVDFRQDYEQALQQLVHGIKARKTANAIDLPSSGEMKEYQQTSNKVGVLNEHNSSDSSEPSPSMLVMDEFVQDALRTIIEQMPGMDRREGQEPFVKKAFGDHILVKKLTKWDQPSNVFATDLIGKMVDYVHKRVYGDRHVVSGFLYAIHALEEDDRPSTKHLIEILKKRYGMKSPPLPS